MNAETLSTLAAAASAHAARIERRTDALARRDAQPFHIAAEDARREAQAANGMGTKAGLMWSITTGNDRKTSDVIDAMVAKHAGSETARADLADALRGWTENAAGLEGVSIREMHETYKPTVREVTEPRPHGGSFSLSPLMLTLIRSAITAIDWRALAVCLLDEHALQLEHVGPIVAGEGINPPADAKPWPPTPIADLDECPTCAGDPDRCPCDGKDG